MNFIHQLIRSLILPNNAGPGDAQIRIGPDVPSCMSGTYVAVILFMPPGWNGGVNAPPSRFIGLTNLTPTASVDMGWVLWDEGSVCGYITTARADAANGGAGALSITEALGFVGSGGVGAVSLANLSTVLGSPLVLTQLSVVANTLFNLASVSGKDIKVRDFGTLTDVSVPRGNRYFIASSVNGGSIGTTPTAVLSGGTWTARAGRAYRVHIFGGGLSTSTSTNRSGWGLNLNGVATLALQWTGPEIGAFPNNVNMSAVMINATASDKTYSTVDVIQVASVGTVQWLAGGAGGPRCLLIEDIGAASDFAGATTL